MKNVSLRQIRAFATIAEEKSFVRAAKRLSVSPSALTIALREMEEEIGLRLFERSTRSVSLTEAGAAFLPVAGNVLGVLSEGFDGLRELAEFKRGNVVVAATSSSIGTVVAPAVAAMGAKFPNIRVRIIEELARSMVERVLSGEVDLAITTSWKLSAGVTSHRLLTDRIGIVCQRDHPLAKQATPLNWKDIGRFPIVALQPGAGIRDLMDNHRKIAAVLPVPRYDASSVSAQLSLVENGAGVAILPAIASVARPGRGLMFRLVGSPSLSRDLTLVHRGGAGLRPAAGLLLSYLSTEVRQLEAKCPPGSIKVY